jgi:Right handed beta helix region
LRRRHGIILGYGGATRRSVCGSNIIQNTSSSGIYRQSATAVTGSVIICNNVVNDTGINTPEGPLASAICLCAQGTGDIVTGNIIDNNVVTGFSVAAGISVQPNPNGAYEIAEHASTLISGNTISNTAAHGVMVINRAQNVAVRDNTIWNSGLSGILVALSPGRPYADHILVEGNRIRIAVAQPAVQLISVGGDTKTRVSVRNNALNGVNRTTNTAENTGVSFNKGFFNQSLTITGNQIERFHNGVLAVNYLTEPLTDIQVAANTFIDCMVGLAASSGTGIGRLVGASNVYRDCAASVGAGSLNGVSVAVEGKLLNGMFTTAAAAPPIAASFNVGDRVERIPAQVGTVKAWRCIVAGAPGTWVSEGEL